MRCLALAEALEPEATDIHFVCRRLPGGLHEFIEDKGYRCSLLPADDSGIDALQDAEQTAALSDAAHWLIVDHYELDRRWEQAMRPACDRLMVIDDLVDRPHDCDVLLDQTYGRRADAYENLTPAGCNVLAGTEYALLRPEFAESRPAALARREASQGVAHILVSMGGFDPENRTLQILETMAGTACAGQLTVTVVSGAQVLDSRAAMDSLAGSFSHLDIRQRVSNMAELMAAADLAIGAGGTTSWERCCLGLPALVLVLADNQREVALNLQAAGAIRVWESRSELAGQLDEFVTDESIHRSAVAAAAGICDGQGLERVVAVMQSC